MITNKYIERVIAVIVAIAVFLCLGAMRYAKELTVLAGGTAVNMQYATSLFDTDKILDVEILMDEADWEEMLSSAIEEEYFQCDVRINDETYYRVGIRPKGNTSLTSIAADPNSDRYSLKLEFNHYVKGQNCQGLDKLILNNNYADATNMKEAIVYDMFRYLGTDASLYNYAKVSVNGEYWGVYLALEAVEESFCMRNYGSENGQLYKPESMGMGGGAKENMDFQKDFPKFQEGNFPGGQMPPEGAPGNESMPEGLGTSGSQPISEEDGTQGSQPLTEGGEESEGQSLSGENVFSNGQAPPQGNGFQGGKMPPEAGGLPGGQTPSEERETLNGQAPQGEGKESGSQLSLEEDETSKAQVLSGESEDSDSQSQEEKKDETLGRERPTLGGDMMRGGGMPFSMNGGGANLRYTDESLESYSTIWEGAVTNSGESDQRRVVDALKELQNGADPEKYLDVDNILRYMAVHTFVVNLDSLSGNMAHNYYLYESGGKLNILPWDYNLAFGGMSMGGSREGDDSSNASDTVNFAVDTPFQGTDFFDVLLENEVFLEQYHGYLQQLTEGYVNGGVFESTYERIRAQIDDLVRDDPTAFYSFEEYEAAAAMLLDVVKLRSESVEGQISGSIPSTTQGQKEDYTTLIDASSIDISVMGTFGGGKEAAMPAGNFGPGAVNAPQIQQNTSTAQRNGLSLNLILYSGSIMVSLIALAGIKGYKRKKTADQRRK